MQLQVVQNCSHHLNCYLDLIVTTDLHKACVFLKKLRYSGTMEVNTSAYGEEIDVKKRNGMASLCE